LLNTAANPRAVVTLLGIPTNSATAKIISNMTAQKRSQSRPFGL